MIPTQTLESYPLFGACATKIQPGDVKRENGFIEGDVYPAEWVNWKWAKDSKGIADANAGLCSIEQEINNVLTCAGITPNLSCTDQLYNAMICKIQDCVGTAAPKAHASAETTYGVGTADCYGHLKISDTYTSVLAACTGVAASQLAVACVYSVANGKAAVGNSAGCALGTAAAGTATTAARSDHVHPIPKCFRTTDASSWFGFLRYNVDNNFMYCFDVSDSQDGTNRYQIKVSAAQGVQDAGNGACFIKFNYTASGISDPSWIAAWDGYTLRATLRDNLCVGCAGSAGAATIALTACCSNLAIQARRATMECWNGRSAKSGCGWCASFASGSQYGTITVCNCSSAGIVVGTVGNSCGNCAFILAPGKTQSFGCMNCGSSFASVWPLCANCSI